MKPRNANVSKAGEDRTVLLVSLTEIFKSSVSFVRRFLHKNINRMSHFCVDFSHSFKSEVSITFKGFGMNVGFYTHSISLLKKETRPFHREC